MKLVITILLWLLLVGLGAAQQPPVQTINTNLGIPCNATGSGGPVTTCKPGWSYGCTATSGSTAFLGTDGNRTAILFQNTSSSPETLTFGDTGTNLNGFSVQPNNSFLWSNMNQGNTPGRVATATVSVTGSGPCVFMFTD